VPSTPGVTDCPRALAASAWVTTEQELKLREVVAGAALVDVLEADGVDAVVLEDLAGDELHPASTAAAERAAKTPITPVRNFGSSLI